MKKEPLKIVDLSPSSKKFVEWGTLYQKITFGMILFSMILFALAAVLVRSVTAAPEALIVFSGYYLAYHGLHAVYGIFRILQHLFVFRKRNEGIRIGGTAISILVTPVSFGFSYLAFFFLALSSCAA